MQPLYNSFRAQGWGTFGAAWKKGTDPRQGSRRFCNELGKLFNACGIWIDNDPGKLGSSVLCCGSPSPHLRS
eukprot:5629667-Pleurochrysis_carterae.AAC.1